VPDLHLGLLTLVFFDFLARLFPFNPPSDRSTPIFDRSMEIS